MDLTPDSDQIALQTATGDWCRTHMPLADARSRPAGLWRDLETMGWVAMTAPGMDLDHAAEALVFAELGRFLAPVALLSSAVAARWTGTSGKVALALPGRDGIRILDSDGAPQALGLFEALAASIEIDPVSKTTPSLDGTLLWLLVFQSRSSSLLVLLLWDLQPLEVLVMDSS